MVGASLTGMKPSVSRPFAGPPGPGPLYFAVEAGFFSRGGRVPPAGNEIFVRRRYDRKVGRPTLLHGTAFDSVPLADGDRVVSGDRIDGPLHTNDDLLICGSPSFGRSSADVIEVSAPPQGWSSGCGGGANPDFNGPFVTNAPVLTPPPTTNRSGVNRFSTCRRYRCTRLAHCL